MIGRREFLGAAALAAVANWQTAFAAAADEKLRGAATAAMRKAAEHYRQQVAYRGGYVYFYFGDDFKQRHGEGPATATQIWVQPPGTPTVGLAYLAAYRATRDSFYLEAAREAGEALRYGQLKSGGWQNVIDFDPKGRVNLYRNGKGGGANNSTLDDGISQTAIQFMARLDEALAFKDAAIHESAQIAHEALLKAQFSNGAFPQIWTGPVGKVAAVKASYPTHDYRTEGKVKDYWNMYTLNDGLAGSVSQTLLAARNVYKDDRYLEALKRLGDFLILAQIPDPQPAWAQQYNRQTQPIWARRFEPPGITGHESQDAIETLLTIHRETGDKKYLEPIPRALAYLKKSLLPDGRLARYYELKTNRPLYMTRRGDEYSLTFDDSDLPDHYGWKVASRLNEIEAQFNAARTGRTDRAPQSSATNTALEIRAIIDALEPQGRWISTYSGERLVGQPKFKPGQKYLSSAVFSSNLESLARVVSES